MLVLAQPALPPDEGLSRLVGLLAAAGVAYAAIMLHQWWQERKIQIPSPTPPRGRGRGEDPQVGDGVTDDDTTDDTDDETPNAWGLSRIRLANGTTIVRRAQAVWRTGSAALPGDDRPAPEPDEDGDGLAEVGGESRAEYADRLVATKMRATDAVAAIMRGYEVSKSTAIREIRKARERATMEG